MDTAEFRLNESHTTQTSCPQAGPPRGDAWLLSIVLYYWTHHQIIHRLNTLCIRSQLTSILQATLWVCKMRTVVDAVCSAPKHMQTFRALMATIGYFPHEVSHIHTTFVHQIFGIWNATRASMLSPASSRLGLVRCMTGYFCSSPPVCPCLE